MNLTDAACERLEVAFRADRWNELECAWTLREMLADLYIDAGETEYTVRIAIKTDDLNEGSERMYLELAGIFGDDDVELIDVDATGTITDT